MPDDVADRHAARAEGLYTLLQRGEGQQRLELASSEATGEVMAELADLMLAGPEQLRQGECYFVLLFHDNALRFPEIQTFVYIGKNIKGESEDRWYFQDVQSYLKHGSAGASQRLRKVQRTLFIADYGEITHMFDFPGLGRALLRLRGEG